MGHISGGGGGGSATTDASLLVSGTLPLGRLSGITTSELSASAAITSGQIASLSAAKLTGTNALPDGVLSTNVPLLSGGNLFLSGTGSTTSAPRTFGISDFADGVAGRWLFGDTHNVIQNAFGDALQIASHHQLELYGGHQDVAPPFSAGSGDFGVGILNTITSRVACVVRGAASQTADLLQCRDSAGGAQFAVTNRGSGASPVWALKVRAVANAESAAQAHTLGAYSGKAIEVMDDAGASLGYLPIYG